MGMSRDHRQEGEVEGFAQKAFGISLNKNKDTMQPGRRVGFVCTLGVNKMSKTFLRHASRN